MPGTGSDARFALGCTSKYATGWKPSRAPSKPKTGPKTEALLAGLALRKQIALTGSMDPSPGNKTPGEEIAELANF
jgi:hypothetical protein